MVAATAWKVIANRTAFTAKEHRLGVIATYALVTVQYARVLMATWTVMQTASITLELHYTLISARYVSGPLVAGKLEGHSLRLCNQSICS